MTIARRLAAAALAGAAVFTGAVVTAAPAQALIRCGDTYCFAVIDLDHLRPRECVCELPLVIDLRDRAVFDRVDVLLNEGAYNFRTAGLTTDRAVRARLEAAGTEQFTQAVRLLSVAPTVKPQPQPWLEAAGTDLVTGLQATFQAERTRDLVAARALRARAAAAYQSFGSR
jgi:hypothetical protein